MNILANGTLENKSLTKVTATKKRRNDILVGIAYDADIKKATEVLLALLEKDNVLLKEEEKSVFVSELGDSAVILCVRAWASNEEYWQEKWKLTEEVKLTLDEYKSTIPFTQMEVHWK